MKPGHGAENDPSRFDFSLRNLAVDPADTIMRGHKIRGSLVVHFSQHLRALQRYSTPKRGILRQESNDDSCRKLFEEKKRSAASYAANILGLRPQLDFLDAAS